MRLETHARVDGTEYVAWWQERYGTAAGLLDGYQFFKRGTRTVWMASPSVQLGELAPVDGVGLPFVRVGSRDFKPTSVAAVHLGATATRNVVEVTLTEAQQLLRRQPVCLDAGDSRRELHNGGYVIARLAEVPFGCVLWRGGELESCVPKGNVIEDLDTPSLPGC